ncbi:MAG: hypothetical protein JRM99_08340 [Nitrososphaerota archaeon]|nr:hypothetical protein [Nitrososphaerota archaeon]
MASIRTIKPSADVYENAVATFVDVGSIMVAYTIGVSQLGMAFGMGYALFDAWMVVWMRKPIFSVIKRVSRAIRGQRDGQNVVAEVAAAA